MPTCCTQVLSHAVSVVAHCCSSFLPLTKAFQAFVRMSAYSDDSEVEYDDPQVVLNRYRKARFRQALASPDSYYRACQELAEVFAATSDCSAARVKKATFAELISDTRLAIEHCDGVARNSTICKALVNEAVRTLPQTKGKELQRLLKSHSLKSAREDNRTFKSVQQSGAPPAMEQVPADILGSVLDQLDPYSLAAAACASKQWQVEAYKEHRWRPFALALVGTASASQQQGSWRELFFQAATGGHTRMAYFRTSRRMLRQTLHWKEAKPWQEPPDFRTVTPQQVAMFILKGSIEEADDDNSDSSGDEEGSLCILGHADMAPAVHKLWRTFPGRLKLTQRD